MNRQDAARVVERWCENQSYPPPSSDVPSSFIVQHAADVIGVLSGFDRLRLMATLRPLYQPSLMMRYLILTDPGRRRLSDQQKRFEPAPGFPSTDRTGRSAHPGVLPESGLVAHAGNVDARQGTGQLRAATDPGSRHRAKPGRGVAGQRSSEPTNPGITLARGRAPRPARGRTTGSSGTGPASRAQRDAKCSGEKQTVTAENPSKFTLSLN